ncbi:MAG: sensor histidine kinase, partial [Oscillospiraceae bacterium]|nr:sensor histidine kinase [Oscillospiraceae bacterium]
VIELWEFFRRKNYYDKLKACLNELDKKYLISEMIESPNFYDGQILFEALQESNKSMCEHIAEYRHRNIEFREYIELWVHEIKLPVASLQLMCHNDNNLKYAEQLRRIDDDIENVLYYARSENAEKDYIIKEVSVKRVFADIAIKNREELQQRNVNLKTENLDVNIMTDSKWLAYILGQLMGNSMKYFSSEREPEIVISIDDLQNQQILHFRDNGIGIPETDLPYIFEKSFTGENGRMYAKSTGMGLYIIKKLCDKLGHCILAESEQDKFTEIMIIFGKNNFLKF